MSSKRTTATALVAAVLCLTACGQQTASPAGGPSGRSGTAAGDDAGGSSDHDTGGGSDTSVGETGGDAGSVAVVRLTAGQPRPQLACPNGERSVMIADVVHGAEGARAPQDAVDKGLVETNERLVVSPRGMRVWILRPDGTARVELGLVHHDGWLLHQRTTCG